MLNFNPADAAEAEFAIDNVTLRRFPLDGLSTPSVVREYSFDTSAEGWTSGGAPAVFTMPTANYAGGALQLHATNNTNTFGYWQSGAADVSVEAERLYRGTFEVRTDVTDQSRVPQMRLRFNTANLQASRTLGIESVGDGANSPATTNTTYDHLYFQPPANCIGEGLIVSFDLLNFNPDDAVNAWFFLDKVIIESTTVPDFASY
jgi:hypothetical protein